MGSTTPLGREGCVIFYALAAFGCTKLGPTPAMSGVPFAPTERPGLELQAAAVPGYYLSAGALEDPRGEAIPAISGVVEPDEVIGVPGVFAGGRYAGSAEAGAGFEPLLGYRRFIDADRRFALGTVGSLVYQSATSHDAEFSARRGALELGLDARLTGTSSFAELHGNVGAQFTGIAADGEYCFAASGYGIDCPSGANPAIERASAELSGIFPSAHAGVALDFGRHLRSVFHGVRLGLDIAGGTLPTLIRAEQRGAKLYGAAGLSLSLGFGARGAPVSALE